MNTTNLEWRAMSDDEKQAALNMRARGGEKCGGRKALFVIPQI